MSFRKWPSNELDPLDHEILEMALDAMWEAIKSADQHLGVESDEELEAVLRRELIEIVRLHHVSDPGTLKEIVLANMRPSLTGHNEPFHATFPAPLLKAKQIRC